MPQKSQRVGVDGIDAVVFGSGINHIVSSLARDVHTRRIKRLGVNITGHRKAAQLSELSLVDVCRTQDCLVQMSDRFDRCHCCGEHAGLFVTKTGTRALCVELGGTVA